MPILISHKWRYNVSTLRNISHTNVLRLPVKDVKPDAHSKGIRQVVLYLSAEFSVYIYRVLYIPLIKISRLSLYARRDTVLSPSQVS